MPCRHGRASILKNNAISPPPTTNTNINTNTTALSYVATQRLRHKGLLGHVLLGLADLDGPLTEPSGEVGQLGRVQDAGHHPGHLDGAVDLVHRPADEAQAEGPHDDQLDLVLGHLDPPCNVGEAEGPLRRRPLEDHVDHGEEGDLLLHHLGPAGQRRLGGDLGGVLGRHGLEGGDVPGGAGLHQLDEPGVGRPDQAPEEGMLHHLAEVVHPVAGEGGHAQVGGQGQLLVGGEGVEGGVVQVLDGLAVVRLGGPDRLAVHHGALVVRRVDDGDVGLGISRPPGPADGLLGQDRLVLPKELLGGGQMLRPVDAGRAAPEEAEAQQGQLRLDVQGGRRAQPVALGGQQVHQDGPGRVAVGGGRGVGDRAGDPGQRELVEPLVDAEDDPVVQGQVRRGPVGGGAEGPVRRGDELQHRHRQLVVQLPLEEGRYGLVLLRQVRGLVGHRLAVLLGRRRRIGEGAHGLVLVLVLVLLVPPKIWWAFGCCATCNFEEDMYDRMYMYERICGYFETKIRYGWRLLGQEQERQ
mmetsp:Transcript_23784/g.68347  ORF Transcript_23784/g.68347 Transcript_23784/m.68347 type:complete len:524 (+) Transcript_23784:105-1676(+)